MSVGFVVGFRLYSVGTGSFLHSFFSTVCVNLEGGTWGSRFPLVMNQLYQGELSARDLTSARAEINQIAHELQLLPPSHVVWDVEDRSAVPPWGDNISPQITHLADYFVTSDGQNLLSLMVKALDTAAELQLPLQLR